MDLNPGLDIFVALLIAAALLESRYHGGDRFFKEGLSRDHCNRLKGLMAVMIVFHHTAQSTAGGELFHPFRHFGYLIVAEFFFLSGYGLMKQYVQKKDYLDGYLNKRLSAVCIPYAGVVALYWLCSRAYRGSWYTPGEVLRSLVNGKPVAANSWYVLVCILLYVLFYLLARLLGSRRLAMAGAAALWCCGWIVLCRTLDYGIHWYLSTFAFVLGMLWALAEEKGRPVLERCYWPLLAAVSAGLFPTFRLTYYSDAELCFGIVSSSLFVVWVLLLTMRVELRSGLLDRVGTVSFELYMIHGLFMRLFRGERFYIDTDARWVAAVLICSLGAAVVLHRVFSAAIRTWRSQSVRRRTA